MGEKPIESVNIMEEQEVKSAEFVKQEIINKDIQEEKVKKDDVNIQKNSEKGAKGLKFILQKELKTSPELTSKLEEISPVVFPKGEPLKPGHMVITVHKARDIEKKGKFGKVDPHVKMTLENQKAKSKTIKNNYNPEWNFTANFEITNETTEGITIEVFDEDIGKDDSLGSMILDLSAVQEYQQFVNQWIPLGKCKSGEVMLSAKFVPLTKLQTDDIVANVISEPIKEAEKESAQEISLIPKKMIVETVIET